MLSKDSLAPSIISNETLSSRLDICLQKNGDTIDDILNDCVDLLQCKEENLHNRKFLIYEAAKFHPDRLKDTSKLDLEKFLVLNKLKEIIDTMDRRTFFWESGVQKKNVNYDTRNPKFMKA